MVITTVTKIIGIYKAHNNYIVNDQDLLNNDYRKVSNIRRTKSQNLNASRLIL